ncbi:4440_t:CDS:2 [Entrophospora sp. SA101]|nr:4440_t:CDS:2 [Entrophospora sp. SA101]
MAHEVLAGLPPHYNISHDANLACKICNGWRLNKDEKFEQQYQGMETTKNLNNNIVPLSYQVHPSAIYTSRLLNFKNLPQPQNSRLINEQFYSLQNKTSELNTHLIKIQQLAKEISATLNLIFQKSDELEKIITTNELTISEEMKSKLIEIKALKARVSELEAEGNNAYQELERKKQQLEVLKNTIISNKPTKEINQLCQYQEEITKLKTQLEETARQGEKQITQVINNITVGSMNVQGGHALFGNQMGNETNLSYNKSADLSETINSKRKKRNS